ncbi:hypothetical protein O181_130953 [Austropuccinia psidii MF-1]|uniref:Uncharacterized protein n=1 Tax=Austropuccinia psidii MF-1 TaxID=1389203 RepID=A0A9Q3KZL1_9BASI|nr:hypothetical protein [Austropuccinia psidii MF-1]
MDKDLQLLQILKYLVQWSMDNQMLNLASHWTELAEDCPKICLKEIPFKGLIVITKGWNPNRKLKLLEKRETRIREKQSTIQAIEEQLTRANVALIFRN